MRKEKIKHTDLYGDHCPLKVVISINEYNTVFLKLKSKVEIQ